MPSRESACTFMLAIYQRMLSNQVSLNVHEALRPARALKGVVYMIRWRSSLRSEVSKQVMPCSAVMYKVVLEDRGSGHLHLTSLADALVHAHTSI